MREKMGRILLCFEMQQNSSPPIGLARAQIRELFSGLFGVQSIRFTDLRVFSGRGVLAGGQFMLRNTESGRQGAIRIFVRLQENDRVL